MSNPSDESRTESTVAINFASRNSVEQVEEGAEFAPKFDRDGLIACVTTDAASGEVLMLGYMNHEALEMLCNNITLNKFKLDRHAHESEFFCSCLQI